jgi:hypothetical protein
MLILKVFLDKKLSNYLWRKTPFVIFEFAAVWSPLSLPLSARVAEYTLTVQKGISTLCLNIKKLRRVFEYGLKMHLNNMKAGFFETVT